MVDGILSVCLSCWCLWNGVNRVLTSIFLSCYIFVGCRRIDGIFGLLSFLIHLRLGCILLLTSEGVVRFDCCLFISCCLIYCVLGVSLRCWCLWNGVDSVFTSIFLSRDILVGCSCIDGILSFLGFFVHLSLSCILLLASQSIIRLDCGLLISCCLIHCILGISLRCWRLWNGVNRVLTSIFLSCYVLIACCRVNGVFGLGYFLVNFRLGCILLLTSEGVISFDGCFLSISSLIDGVLGISLSSWGLLDIIDCLSTLILLSRHIVISCRSIDGIFSLLRFGVNFGFSGFFFLTGQVRIFLNRIFLRVSCLSNRIFCVSLSRWGLRHIIDGFSTFILLSRYIRVACCSIDSVFSLLSFFVNFRFCYVLLFTS